MVIWRPRRRTIWRRSAKRRTSIPRTTTWEFATFGKGELKAAEFEFRRVIELNSNGAQAYFNLGNVLYITKHHEEAKQTLEVGAAACAFFRNGGIT